MPLKEKRKPTNEEKGKKNLQTNNIKKIQKILQKRFGTYLLSKEVDIPQLAKYIYENGNKEFLHRSLSIMFEECLSPPEIEKLTEEFHSLTYKKQNPMDIYDVVAALYSDGSTPSHEIRAKASRFRKDGIPELKKRKRTRTINYEDFGEKRLSDDETKKIKTFLADARKLLKESSGRFYYVYYSSKFNAEKSLHDGFFTNIMDLCNFVANNRKKVYGIGLVKGNMVGKAFESKYLKTHDYLDAKDILLL